MVLIAWFWSLEWANWRFVSWWGYGLMAGTIVDVGLLEAIYGHERGGMRAWALCLEDQGWKGRREGKGGRGKI